MELAAYMKHLQLGVYYKQSNSNTSKYIEILFLFSRKKQQTNIYFKVVSMNRSFNSGHRLVAHKIVKSTLLMTENTKSFFIISNNYQSEIN